MSRRAAALAVVMLVTIPSRSLAVRGIDAPYVERPPKPCSERLRAGMQVDLRIDDATEPEIRGKIASVDGAGIGLRVRDIETDAISYFDRSEILTIRTPKRRFPRPLSSLKGFGLGMALGMGVALAAGYPNEGSNESPPDLGAAVFVLGGAAVGLVLGTAIPIIYPGEKEIECAW